MAIKRTTKKKPDNKPNTTLSSLQDINKDRVLDIFVSPSTLWSPEDVSSAINAHRNGTFNRSGRLVDNMLGDARLASVLDTRTLGVLSLPFEWKFDNQPSEKDKQALSVLESYWNSIFSSSIAAQLLRTTILMGFSISSIYWESEDKYWIPKLTVWHPSNTFFNTANRQYCALTYNQGMLEVDEDDYRWMLIKNLDNERAFISAAVIKLGAVYLTKQYALADWRTNSATYGNPIRKLSTTMEAAIQIDVFQFIKDITQRIRMGAPIALPAGFDLTQMEATEKSPEMFSLLIDKCDTAIAIGVLGQNLTTDSTQGNGSYALGTVHAKVMQNYIEADVCMLEEAIYNQLVIPFYNFNFDESVQVPKPRYNSVPPEDLGEISKGMLSRSQSLVHLSDALTKMKDLDLLKEINMDELFREFRLPLKSDISISSLLR